MGKKKRGFKSDDFDFMPKEKREVAARLMNRGTVAAAHFTLNSGKAKLQEPDEQISSDIAKLLYGT